MGLIFFLSAQTAAESAKTSSGFLYNLISVLYPEFQDITKAEQQQILSFFSFYIRKAAHFGLFGGLGAISFLNFSFFETFSLSKRAWLSVGFSSVYAASDEFHQIFVKGRSCEIRDWLIDSAGICLAVLVLTLIVALYRKRKKRARVKMKKSELFSEYKDLLSDFREEFEENKALKKSLEERKNEIELLNNEISQLNKKEKAEETSKILEAVEQMDNITEEKLEERELKDYGAMIIGKTVISSAEYSARIDTEDIEIGNAAKSEIFERTELLKAEIFDIICSDYSLASKKQQMEREYRSAINDFDRILRRI